MKDELTLRTVWQAIKRYFWVICLVTAISTVGAFLITKYAITPMYTTRISMCVFANRREGDGNAITSGELQADSSVAHTYQLLLTSQPVMEAVSEALDNKVSPADIQSMISTDVNSQVIFIDITSEDPEIAYEVGEALSDVAPRTISDLARAGEMTAVNRAYLPASPSSPNMIRNIVLGFLIGLLASCGFAVVRHLTDTTIWNAQVLEETFKIPVIGSIPMLYDQGKKKRRSV